MHCSPQTCGPVCRSGTPPWRLGLAGAIHKAARSPHFSGSVPCHLVSCLTGNVHRSKAVLPIFQGMFSGVGPGKGPGPRGRKKVEVPIIEIC